MLALPLLVGLDGGLWGWRGVGVRLHRTGAVSRVTLTYIFIFIHTLTQLFTHTHTHLHLHTQTLKEREGEKKKEKKNNAYANVAPTLHDLLFKKCPTLGFSVYLFFFPPPKPENDMCSCRLGFRPQKAGTGRLQRHTSATKRRGISVSRERSIFEPSFDIGSGR